MRRGEKEKKKMNHRQCATRVIIISMKIGEGKKREIRSREFSQFLFATFRRCNSCRREEGK